MKRSVYMTWAKQHAAARYNLANSGILGCELADLPLTAGDIVLNGPNHEGYLPLKEAIAARYDVQPQAVMPVQGGTSMANFLAMATVIERGDEVLIEKPTYEPLLAAADYLGATIKRFERRFENRYQVDPQEIGDLLSARTKLIIITSPHNPSAVVVDRTALQSIGTLTANRGVFVLVDEAYRDILLDDAPPPAAHFGEQFISTSSLTKSHGLNGLRCGWILCQPAMTERMRRLNDLLGAVAAMPSDHLAVIAFRHLDALNSRTKSILDPNLALAHQFLDDHRDLLDCVIPRRSMMVFPRLRHETSSDGLHDRLRSMETSIVPGRFFEAPGHFRLGFAGRTADVATGLTHLSAVLRNT